MGKKTKKSRFGKCANCGHSFMWHAFSNSYDKGSKCLKEIEPVDDLNPALSRCKCEEFVRGDGGEIIPVEKGGTHGLSRQEFRVGLEEALREKADSVQKEVAPRETVSNTHIFLAKEGAGDIEVTVIINQKATRTTTVLHAANAEGLTITRNSSLESDAEKSDLFNVKFTGLYSNEQGGTHDMRTIPTDDTDESASDGVYSVAVLPTGDPAVMVRNEKTSYGVPYIVRTVYFTVPTLKRAIVLAKLLNEDHEKNG